MPPKSPKDLVVFQIGGACFRFSGFERSRSKLRRRGRPGAAPPAGSAGVKRSPRGPAPPPRFPPPLAGFLLRVTRPGFAQICPFPPPLSCARRPQAPPSRGAGTWTSPGLSVPGPSCGERASAMPFRKGRRGPSRQQPGDLRAR